MGIRVSGFVFRDEILQKAISESTSQSHPLSHPSANQTPGSPLLARIFYLASTG